MEIKKIFCQLDDDILCEHKTTDEGELAFHNHDGYELLLLLHGDINYYIEGEGLHLERGNLICVKPYDFHRREIMKKGNYERIVIHIKESFLESLSTKHTDVSECFYRVPAGKINVLQFDEEEIIQYSLLTQQLSQVLSSNDYGTDILVDAYIKQILVMVNQHSRNKKIMSIKNIMPPLVAETISFIDKNISEKITLEILSDHLNYNGTYISRSFKKIYGISIQQYIISKRITLAKKYLIDGYSPSDACFLSGFNDYSNFSRTFAKHVGCSPIKYQAQLQ